MPLTGTEYYYILLELAVMQDVSDFTLVTFGIIFTCVSYAEARNSYRLDVRPSVRHTLAPYQNG